MFGALTPLCLALLAPPVERLQVVVQPDCRASIERQCDAVAALERAVCESAFYAHCHVEEAGRRVADKDMVGAISELKLASARYDTLFRVTDGSQLRALSDLLIRYADAIAKVFTPGQLAGEGPVMNEAGDHLRRGYQRLLELGQRRPTVAGDAGVRRITETVAEKCRDILEDLGRIKLREATQDPKSMALAEGLANAAAGLFREARRMSPGAPEREVTLLKLQVAAQLFHLEYRRRGHQQEGIQRRGTRDLCGEHRVMLAEIRRFRTMHPRLRDDDLSELERRVEATVSQCAGRRLMISGAVLGGLGALALAASVGLYADYDRACERDAAEQCTGIGADELGRYTRQVHASLGLFVVGLTFIVPSIPLLAVGGKRSAPLYGQRARLAPVVTPVFVGAGLSLKF
ncbi:hypothetical protein [Nannocystis pusilla]|uniref:hypothetical protein n=1 Tax=Nannocystis pusilla TaxID=889268 RepID=UPI003DA5A550